MNCSYCGNNTNLTLEHIFPDSFYKHLNLKKTKEFEIYDIKSHKYSQKELKIKDVCDTCNNVILSSYDKSFIPIFNDIIQNNNILQIDYIPLLKWLLKTFYNSHRYVSFNLNNRNTSINSDASIYKKYFLDFILNKQDLKNAELFIIPLKEDSFNSDFSSIGSLILEKELSKELYISDFIQIKNYIFIVTVSRKNHISIKDKMINILRDNYNAMYIPKNTTQVMVDIENAILENICIFNANEKNTSIPFKVFCRLDWYKKNQNRITLQDYINNTIIFYKNIAPTSIPKYKLKTINYIKVNELILKSTNKRSEIIVTEKNVLLSVSGIATFVYEKKNHAINYLDAATEKSLEKYKEIKISKLAKGIIKRESDATFVLIKDLNSQIPFVDNCKINQISERWEQFKYNIIKNNNCLFIGEIIEPDKFNKILENNIDNEEIVKKTINLHLKLIAKIKVKIKE